MRIKKNYILFFVLFILYSENICAQHGITDIILRSESIIIPSSFSGKKIVEKKYDCGFYKKCKKLISHKVKYFDEKQRPIKEEFHKNGGTKIFSYDSNTMKGFYVIDTTKAFFLEVDYEEGRIIKVKTFTPNPKDIQNPHLFKECFITYTENEIQISIFNHFHKNRIEIEASKEGDNYLVNKKYTRKDSAVIFETLEIRNDVLVQKKTYFNYPVIERFINYFYEDGNLTQVKSFFNYSNSSDSVDFKLVSQKDFEYYDSGLLKLSEGWLEGDFWYKKIFEYNDKGDPVTIFNLSKKGKVISKTVLEYEY